MARTQRAVQPHLRLDPDVQPAAQRLVDAVLRAVAEGDLLDGDLMPSSRALATTTQLSRSCVVEAYETLCGIGVLIAEQGSGTRVADGARMLLANQPAPEEPTRTKQRLAQMDLSVPGSGSEEVIDLREWNRAWREAIRPGQSTSVQAELANQVASHLRSFRGVNIAERKMLMRPSMGAALADLVHGLDLRARSVAIESPCNPRIQRHLVNAGCRVHCIPVDEQGLRVSCLRPDDAAVIVSPARQWPTGVALSPERREELLAWSQRTGGTIIEDDQDAEFSYGRAPLPTLYATAPADAKVIYLGSSWKLVAPDLHVVWTIVPANFHSLSEDVAPISVYTARALSNYISSGALYRHRNRAQHLFEERRSALLRHLEENVPGVVVSGAASGTELLLELPAGCDELAVQHQIESAGFVVSTLGDFAFGRHRPCLLVEFSQLPPMMAYRFAGALNEAVS